MYVRERTLHFYKIWILEVQRVRILCALLVLFSSGNSLLHPRSSFQGFAMIASVSWSLYFPAISMCLKNRWTNNIYIDDKLTSQVFAGKLMNLKLSFVSWVPLSFNFLSNVITILVLVASPGFSRSVLEVCKSLINVTKYLARYYINVAVQVYCRPLDNKRNGSVSIHSLLFLSRRENFSYSTLFHSNNYFCEVSG